MSRRPGTRKDGLQLCEEASKIAYFDCFSGISGDMCLGALVDAGVPLKELSAALRRLPVRGYALSARRVLRAGIAATKVDVVLTKKNGAPKKAIKWENVRKTILSSTLPEDLRQKGLGVFRLLFEAEARVHGGTFGEVHLHELGAADCMVDIFGTLIGLDLLGVKDVYASPVNLGGGSVRTRHGIMPVPAPATAEILRDVPVYPSGIPVELATPTGAALLKYLARGFVSTPAFSPERIGSGAGDKDTADSPNILRIFIGHAPEIRSVETITVIETNIDDMSPQAYEYVAERLFKAGALDVTLTQTIMKKMRPAITLGVICSRAVRDELVRLILTETTSIGVRYFEGSRVTMHRKVIKVATRYGAVRVKFSSAGDIRKITPEYEDCRSIATKKGVGLLEVIEEAKSAARREAEKEEGKRGTDQPLLTATRQGRKYGKRPAQEG
jgi:uncharacterized protein (TIGR00299 family) protein